MSTKIKYIINPEFQQLESFIREIPYTFEQQGTTIYKERNEIKVVENDGVLLNIKQYKCPIWINRISYSFLRKSKAERAYNYALVLLKKHIPTPTPVAYILEYRNGLLALSYLITLQVKLRRSFYEFGKGPLTGRENIIRDFAIFTAAIHDKGVLHKDYSPGNILFDVQPDGNITFSIVDINRMKFGKISIKKGCENFARLWGKKDMFDLLAATYAEKRNFNIEQCRHWTLQARERFWKNRAHDFYEYE